MSISEKTKKYIEQLSSESKKEREAAIKALSKKHSKELIEQIILQLKEKTASINYRISACKIFKNLKAKEAKDILIELLNDSDDGVRYNAIIALGNIDDFNDVKPLIRKLKQKRTDPILKSELIFVLGNIGDDKAIDSLINILRNDTDKFVRHHAARALGKIGNQRAIPALTEIANREKNTRLYYLSLNAIENIKKG